MDKKISYLNHPPNPSALQYYSYYQKICLGVWFGLEFPLNKSDYLFISVSDFGEAELFKINLCGAYLSS